ncbi:hypothetical protein SVIO_045130 [Streptomyces violaceusniger]|uniref:Uncharacterized protein n=1 Tax=Streptomyces violaceusniger TaxID=68280 RepID=A0A4D4L4I3_STRVO|nr:hypothetical protein SVIO_045130 [Streptomyces violaceusniger]
MGHGERFDQVVVGAVVEQPDDLALVVTGGGHDDRHIGDAAQHLERLRPVQIGQAEVQDDDVESDLRHLAQRLQGGADTAHGMGRLGQLPYEG